MSKGPEGTHRRLSFACPPDAVATFLDALDDDAISVAAVEEAPARWLIEAIAPAGFDLRSLERRVAAAADAAGGPRPEVRIEALPERDWLRENLANFGSLAVGRFVIQGTHLPPPVGGVTPILIDAATAFGTGEHPTTQGCLEAMAMLARRRRVKCVLDLGTGSGLLAIAAARLGARRVVAIDNDAEAVRVAARHVALNRRRGQVTVGLSDGYAGAIARRHSPYDLVLANVLAGPLIAMARDTARAIAPRGHAILSGLLDEQAGEVLGVHRRLGLRLVDRRSLQGWTTLVLAARTI